MRQYELVVIFSTEKNTKTEKKSAEEIKKLITSLKGKVDKIDDWGLKTLSYPIKKQTTGLYIQFNFSLPEEKTAQLKKSLLANENIIRYLLIRGGA
jgi:small subunit ribosomal protein S6